MHNSLTNVHRDAEQHPFGQRMAQGDITEQEWADWLYACFCLQTQIDLYLPEVLRRSHHMLLDLTALAKKSITPHRDVFNDDSLYGMLLLGGISYILSGANVRGGQVIRKQLEPKGFPVAHLTLSSDEMAIANEALVPLRDTFESLPETIEAFKIMLSIMDNIEKLNKS